MQNNQSESDFFQRIANGVIEKILIFLVCLTYFYSQILTTDHNLKFLLPHLT